MASFKASPVSRMLSQKVRRSLGNLGIELLDKHPVFTFMWIIF